MKKYVIYRNIRKRALIYGLPVNLFALMAISVIGSLLILVFSLSFLMCLIAVTLNLGLYFLLLRLTVNPQLIQLKRVFPEMISNKRTSNLDYEN